MVRSGETQKDVLVTEAARLAAAAEANGTAVEIPEGSTLGARHIDPPLQHSPPRYPQARSRISR